jgi:hypothetical protein
MSARAASKTSSRVLASIPVHGWKDSVIAEAERPLACFGDRLGLPLNSPTNALSGRGGISEPHQLCQFVGREAVHAHDSFGAASRATTGEQRKGAALIGLRAGLSSTRTWIGCQATSTSTASQHADR